MQQLVSRKCTSRGTPAIFTCLPARPTSCTSAVLRADTCRYALPHASSAHYKLMLKALLKAALAPSDVQLVKDTETCLAGIRSDKLKEERSRAVAAKGELSLEQRGAVVLLSVASSS